MISIQKGADIDVGLISRSSARAIPGAEGILREWLKRSEEVWQGSVDGELACIWGVVPPTLLSESAWLWMLYDPKHVEEHKFFLVRNSQRYIEYLLTRYQKLVGMVDPNNKGSIRWLKWLGAEFGSVKNGAMIFTIEEH